MLGIISCICNGDYGGLIDRLHTMISSVESEEDKQLLRDLFKLFTKEQGEQEPRVKQDGGKENIDVDMPDCNQDPIELAKQTFSNKHKKLSLFLLILEYIAVLATSLPGLLFLIILT